MASLNQAGIDASATTTGGHAAEFGASLREIRLAHQRELADVAADLRIRQVFLQAIEEGRFEDLPGPTYAVGFVRAYADYLGLEVEEVLHRFKEMGGGVAPQTSLLPPSIVAEGRLPTGSVLLVAALLAMAAYGGWYSLSLEGQDADDGIAALPQRIAALVGMGAEPEQAAVAPVPDEKPAGGGDANAPAESAPAQEATPTEQPVTAEPATEQAAAPAEPAETAAVAAETPPGSGPSDSAAASTTPPPAPTDVSTTPPPAPAAAETPTAATPPEPGQSAAMESATPPPTRVQVVAASSEPQTAEQPAPVAAAQTPAAAPPEAPAAPEPPVAPAAPKPVAAAPAEMSQSTSQATSEAPAAATRQQEAAADAAPSPANDTPAARQVAVTAAAGPRVMLRASATVWVEVREGSAKPILSRLMHAGETFEVPARPGMVMTTGNAGGLEILIDGRTLPPLGPNGAVRSNVALDAASLLKQTRGAR